MAEDWVTLEKKLLRKRSAEARRAFRRSVRPMYRNSADDPRLEIVGSCTLLDVDGPVLSTAAHILDNIATGYSVYVGGDEGTHPVLVRGGVLRGTPLPPGGRDLDHYDTGYWMMPAEALRELGNVEFIDASRLSDPSADTARRYYMTTGFRLKRNRTAIDHVAKRITNRPSRYSGTVEEMPKLAAKIGVSGAEHLFMRLAKFGQNEDDQRVNTFGPRGFSGGSLLDLGDFTVEEAYAPDTVHHASLAGMMTGYYPEFRAMAAVRIEYVVAGIRLRLGHPISPAGSEVRDPGPRT